MSKLFIVGFPREMDEPELLEMLSIYGSVDELTIVRDHATHQSKGYGFIKMVNRSAADRVIAGVNGSLIGDRTLSVRLADKDRVDPGSNSVKDDRNSSFNRSNDGNLQTVGRLKQKRPRK